MKNGISKFTNGVTHRNEYLDLKKRLPRTVLEECIVELADSSSKMWAFFHDYFMISYSVILFILSAKFTVEP